MKQRCKSSITMVIGIAAITMLAPQAWAAGEHGVGKADDVEKLAHMSDSGGPQSQMAPGMMMRPGMSGQGMMGPGMMRHRGMMGGGMQGQGMMGPGMMMQPGTMTRGGGHGLSMLIRPIVHLTVDDVRHALEHRLERRGNKRLKLGDVKTADDDAIIAEIVTVDDSLVERFKIDRHSGRVERVE